MIFWDIHSNERYTSITSSYYKGSNGFFVIYDITSRKSFEQVQYWLHDCYSKINVNVSAVLVGNKLDLECDRMISINEGQQLANSLGMEFFETSAKDSIYIKESIHFLLGEVILRMKF